MWNIFWHIKTFGLHCAGKTKSEIYFVARNPSLIQMYHPKGNNDEAFVVTSCEIYSMECWITCIFQNVLCLFKFRYVCLLQIQIIVFPFILVHHVLYLLTHTSVKALCFSWTLIELFNSRKLQWFYLHIKPHFLRHTEQCASIEGSTGECCVGKCWLFCCENYSENKKCGKNSNCSVRPSSR